MEESKQLSQKEIDEIVTEARAELDRAHPGIKKFCACQRCGYEWGAIVENPMRCPKCQSVGWRTRAGRPGRPPAKELLCPVCEQKIPRDILKEHVRIHDHECAIEALRARINYILTHGRIPKGNQN